MRRWGVRRCRACSVARPLPGVQQQARAFYFLTEPSDIAQPPCPAPVGITLGSLVTLVHTFLVQMLGLLGGHTQPPPTQMEPARQAGWGGGCGVRPRHFKRAGGELLAQPLQVQARLL